MIIRPATSEDSSFLAWAILTATRSHMKRGWFDIALDRPENECVEFLKLLTTTTTCSYWHYSQFVIAEVDDHPVATLCAFRARDSYPGTPAAMVEAMARWGVAPGAAESIWRRGAYIFKCTIRPDNDSWVIDNIATVPESRRCGYTSVLMEHALEHGRRSGAQQAQINFFIGNDVAERAYVRAGFRFSKERRDPDFEVASGAPGIRQYVRALVRERQVGSFQAVNT